MPKQKTTGVWLDRSLTLCAYCFCLCTSAEELNQIYEALGVEPYRRREFCSSAFAATHVVPESENHRQACIVCMDLESARRHTGPQTAALLCHEAVHVWQRHAVYIGTNNDHGDEEEAYAIQSIAQSLMEEIARRLHPA